jgi:hypothetical protein
MRRRGPWAAALTALGVAAAWAGGARRWRARTYALQRALSAQRLEPEPAAYDEAELTGLPPVVQRFFRATLRPGQPLVAEARLAQHGTMNLAAGAWAPFTSTQRVAAQRPGFVWDAVVTMGRIVPVRVHDAYVGGEGRTEAALLGLLPVADVGGTAAAAEAQLVRFLAEAPWYPTVLLPSQGVQWRAVDEQRAEATMRDGAATATVVFAFADDGRIESVHAAARGRTVDGELVPTPWGGRFTDHAERAGMRVPLRAEVFWDLLEGERPYWRGRIDAIDYVWTRSSE